MAGVYRNHVYRKIVDWVLQEAAGEQNARHLVRICDATKKFTHAQPQLKVPLAALAVQGDTLSQAQTQLRNQVEDVADVTRDHKFLYVRLHPHKFNQRVVESVLHERASYGYHDNNNTASPGHILVEYSSPNVAKPFHAGHLRSTLIGSFISNLYTALGHRVTRLNFLGDWGTQFGLLLVGYLRHGDARKLEADPLFHLFEVYVQVNRDVAQEQAEGDNSTYQEGLQMFARLEKGEPESVQMWEQFCAISKKEYTSMYQRLGVEFSAVHSESMFHSAAADLLKQLTRQGTLLADKRGVGYVELHGQDGEPQKATLGKSDGSTLYLTRDVAAALDRYKHFQFDRMHYVVDQSQREHFQQLRGMLRLLGHRWPDQPHFHVAFGQVRGMSTRRGDVVFLRDILDEAARRMLESLQARESTRAGIDMGEVAEALGISSVIIQDLRVRRTSSYTFSWDRMLNFKSDSGVFLQYCHARLTSVLHTCGSDTLTGCDGQHLMEDVACQLLLHIARYQDTVQEAMESLEPCVIVQYLFKLGHLSNAAYRHLPVKTQDSCLAQARLSLFASSRQTLRNGLQLLGIQPLDRM